MGEDFRYLTKQRGYCCPELRRSQLRTKDLYEQIIERALIAAGVEYTTDNDGTNPLRLDFYLPAFDLHIEVKTCWTGREQRQMRRAHNVILVQGRKSVEWLAQLIAKEHSHANAE